jgi:hypothetical protein
MELESLEKFPPCYCISTGLNRVYDEVIFRLNLEFEKNFDKHQKFLYLKKARV